MEPILELAIRMTSQVWILHELYPEEASIDALLGKPWANVLEEKAVHDFSVAQILLDLADSAGEDDWDPKDPLSRFETKEVASSNLLARATRMFQKKPVPGEAVLQHRRRAAGIFSLETLRCRFENLQRSGLSEKVDLTPRPRKKAKAAPQLPTAGDPVKKVEHHVAEAQAGPSLLTREELVEKMVNWLFGSRRGRNMLARVFRSPEGFLIEKEINDRAEFIRNNAAANPTEKAWADRWACIPQSRKIRLLMHRPWLREICHKLTVPVPFSMVLADELDEIALSRLVRLYGFDPAATSNTNESRQDKEVDLSAEASAATCNQKRTTNARHFSGVAPDSTLYYNQALQSGLFGVALSGGGIRSATFALGLLQGMADRNVLPYIDILSTVSGGGYIGTWLTAWIKRRGSVDLVQQSLRGSASQVASQPKYAHLNAPKTGKDRPDPLDLVTHNSDPRADHVRPIRLLREYSRYLAPQAGLLSADFWTIVTTWIRNTTLNLDILILFFGAVLLLPRIAIYLLLHLRFPFAWVGGLMANSFTLHLPYLQVASYDIFRGLAVLLASVPILVGCVLIGTRNLNTFGAYRWKNAVGRGNDDAGILYGIAPWILSGAFLEVTVLWELGITRRTALFASGVFCLVFVIGILILWLFSEHGKPRRRGVHAIPGIAVAFIGAGAAGFALIQWFCSVLNSYMSNTERGLWWVGSAGFALMLAIIGFVVMLFVGLLGRRLSDEQREWWSRMAAWFGLLVGGWLLMCVICFFMPRWIAMLGLNVAAAGLSWVAITAAGAKLAFSPASGVEAGASEKKSTSRVLLDIVMNIAPFVFIFGLLSAVSFALFWALQWLTDAFPQLSGDPQSHQLCCTNLPLSLQRMVDYYWPLMDPGSISPVVLLIGLTVLCLIMAWRVDINEFSMHYFYKNRLVRAYLGASRARAHRFPNAFTGFDLDDDIRLARFKSGDPSQVRDMAMDCKASYAGPYPIVNTALNVTRGADLGIQERKAESFVFTPLWSGFDFSRKQTTVKQMCLSEYAFQKTELFGEPDEGGVLSGTAMAISGAAVSSNMGFHTSPSIAFLLTVFGVRLGWWAGNPRGLKWKESSPRFGLLYLIKELTANTTTASNFVLLSDGGHFENMGLYELIRRRCSFIIVSDAEEDPKFKLEGIGGAIRKCRDDFGVDIDLNVDVLQPLGDPGVSRLHYSIGRVTYPGESKSGRLVYIKSSVTGDESLDVIEFRKRYAEFPHISTTNQFFDESHFESYRALGHHVASGIFVQDMPELPLRNAKASDHVERLFERIEEAWIAQASKLPKDTGESLRSVRETAPETGKV